MKKLKVTLAKSPIDKVKKHKLTLKALGLKKIGKTVILPDNKAMRGMINQLAYMLKIEEIKDAAQ
jgi:large subunit ribosomal protein L30